MDALTPERSKKPWRIIILVLVGGVVCWWGYKEVVAYFKRREAAHAREIRRSQDAEKISSLVHRYNAISDWDEKMTEKDLEHAYSVELEDAVVNTGRSILIREPIDDVVKKGGKYFLFVHGPYSNLRFVLECTPDIAVEIVKNHKEDLQYAILAQVESVEKAEFKIEPASAPAEGEARFLIEVDASDLFYARGRCIEAIPTLKEDDE